jgi:poly(3-hydroxybutyrate) depolymerase
LAGPAITVQESQCIAAGWQRLLIDAAGLQRAVLWKAPSSGWSRGALVVMHGGGGQHANYCVANSSTIAAQVRLTDLALAQGFAVFLPDSSDRVTDTEGRLCGKVWDDEVRGRANLDLPFLEHLISVSMPALRPAGSRAEVFLAGHSSGGYMAVRAATKLADRVKAFAPVASGDPYGWFRDCTPRATDRINVFGAGFDNETRRQIIEPGACSAAAYPQEKAWDGATLAARPTWRAFHHEEDGINDVSCVYKVSAQLRSRGYPETPALRLTGGARSADAHAWLDSYNQPLLDFFIAQLR